MPMTTLETLLTALEVRGNRLYLPQVGLFSNSDTHTAVQILTHYKPIDVGVRYFEYSGPASIIKNAILHGVAVEDIIWPIVCDVDVDVILKEFVTARWGKVENIMVPQCPILTPLCGYVNSTVFYFSKTLFNHDTSVFLRLGDDFLKFESSTRFDHVFGVFTGVDLYMDLTFKTWLHLQINGQGIIVIPRKWMQSDGDEESAFRDWIDEVNAEIYNLPHASDNEKYNHEKYNILILTNNVLNKN